MDPKEESWLIFIGALVLFGTLSFILPTSKMEQGLVEAILSITSILFGLLAGFFISQMWQKFCDIREYSAEFETYLISWIRAMEFLDGNEEVKKEFKEKMEQYLIVWLALPWHYANKDEKYFKRVHDLMGKVKITREREEPLYEKLLDYAAEAMGAREKLIVVGKQKLFAVEWIILLSLSTIIIVAAFLLRQGSLLFNLTSTILPSVVVLSLLILRDLDNLKWNVTNVSFEPAETPLDELGVPRFYEKKALEKLNIRIPEDKEYRTEDDLKGKAKEAYKEIDEKGWNEYKEQY